MKAKKLLAFVLVTLLAVASFAPAFAAERENVLLGAPCINTVNVNESTYRPSTSELSPNGRSDAGQAVEGLYGVGPTHKVDSMNAQIADQWLCFDADGIDADDGIYLWSMTFDLGKICTVDGVALIVDDLTTCGIGDSHPIQWVQRGFHILVSTTGEAGSWKIAHEAEDLHPEDDKGKYGYVDPSDDHPLGYFIYEADFDAVEAKYIRYAATTTTTDILATGNWINISELEIYGTAALEETEDTTPVTEDTTPVTEDTTPVTEDTTPVTPDAPATFDFVIVPAAVLSAAAAGVAVLRKKKN